jgi:hypothetical protein
MMVEEARGKKLLLTMSKKNKMEDNGLERTYNINPIGEAADI